MRQKRKKREGEKEKDWCALAPNRDWKANLKNGVKVSFIGISTI